MTYNGCRSRDKHAAEQTPVTGPDNEPGRVADSKPAEHGDCPGAGCAEQDDHWLYARACEVWQCTTECRGAVDDGDHVER